jgi:hypothetical protein
MKRKLCLKTITGISINTTKRFPLLGMIVLLLAFAVQLNAQTVIVDPTITSNPNGSFDNATATFAANGWSIANNATNKWVVGSFSNCGAPGSKAAYISNTGLNNSYTLTTAAVSHLYIPVSFPAGQTCITLSFSFKGQGQSATDGLKVFLGSSAVAPVANTDYMVTDATAVQLGATWYNLTASCTTFTITIPGSFAGTTKNLVFSWKNNASSGTNPAATLDNVQLVSNFTTVPPCATLNLPANNAINQAACNPTLSWTAGVAGSCNPVSQYYIYFGTTTNPPLLDSTSATSYTLGILNNSTKYYWRIVPKNSAGLNAACITEFNFTTGATVCSTTPGGAGAANIQIWLKADANITVSAGVATQWNNNVSPNVTGNFTPANRYFGSPAQTAPSYAATGYNYNPAVKFDGITQSLTSANNILGDNIIDPDNNTVIQVFYHYGAGSVWLKWDADVAGTHRLGFQRNGSNLRADFPNSSTGANTMSTVNIANNLNLCTFTTDPVYSTTRLQGTNDAPLDISAIGGYRDMGMSSYIGLGNATNTNAPTKIDLSEIIWFDRKLTPAEITKTETYLAIKYGLSLSSNYIAPSNAPIYLTSSPYNLNIIGIGREDVEAFAQKQSHTIDDTVRIYKGTLNATNAGNAASFASNDSYVVMGANNGRLSNTVAALAEAPVTCFLYSRMEREWKLTNTNFAEKFNLDIKLPAAANPGLVNVADLRLLVDDDGNFGNGGTTCYYNGDGTGLVISYSNPVITITGIANTHIPVNATKYITIGSANPLTPLLVQLLNFSAECQENKMAVEWSTASEINNQDFELQRSEDGSSFKTIALIKGQVNSTMQHNYQYTDMNVAARTVYYRLKQSDVNGQLHYSNIIKVNNACNPAQFRNFISFYPNPASGTTITIKYSVQSNEEIGIKAYDVTGRIILQKPLSIKQGTAELNLNLPNLTKGIYFIQFVSTQLDNKPQKLIVE